MRVEADHFGSRRSGAADGMPSRRQHFQEAHGLEKGELVAFPKEPVRDAAAAAASASKRLRLPRLSLVDDALGLANIQSSCWSPGSRRPFLEQSLRLRGARGPMLLAK